MQRDVAQGARREGRRIAIRGIVQGVGFRPWVYRLAREEGIAGWVRNDDAGVTIEAHGAAASLEAFLRRLAAPPVAAAIDSIDWQPIPAASGADFAIAASARAAAPRVSIPPDLAVCDKCLAEVFDPADRRYRYAFTNCTDCGPRFTLVRAVPYDRGATTMAAFAMCPRCRREYDDPGDRRFHAQPNACPECGPRLWLARPDGAEGEELRVDDPLAAAGRALRADLIVAVKGLGGFHLACDATSALAVGRLRARKRREVKPFAVMVRDLEAAEALALLGPREHALLAGAERPIVLAPGRPDSPLAAEVGPGTTLVGLLLAYTPLHHLLLAEAGRPLVMTSGNLAEEPIAAGNDEALARLGAVADLFLLHDREIENRCDDSVARVVAGKPVVLRRGRGYVPRPLRLALPVARPVLACGGQLKNTFCIAVDDLAYLGPHVGDLESLPSCEAFAAAVASLERLLGVVPQVLAHDLHPGYFTTRWARERPAARRVAVQHHHAHVASAIAEHGLAGAVYGLAWDGTGDGGDGTAWGGELLLASAGAFSRLGTFRPLALPGGDLAIREVWRIALALLDDAFAGHPPLAALPLFDGLAPRRLELVRRMTAARLQTPLAHGVGRYFDALGAIGLGRQVSRYEGEVATAWNLAADCTEGRAYPFAVAGTGEGAPWVVDLRPLVRAAVADLLSGRRTAGIAGRFHATLAHAAAALVDKAAARHGHLPVVLTGGCFSNPLLAERVRAALEPRFTVHLHGEVPPGDGGLALGQAVVADAVCRGEEGG